MRSWMIIVGVLLFGAGVMSACSESPEASQEPAPTKASAPTPGSGEPASFDPEAPLHAKAVKIDGIHCAGCAEAIGDQLARVPGVLRSNVMVDQGLALVQFQASEPADEAITHRIEYLGYTVVSIPPADEVPATQPAAPATTQPATSDPGMS